VQGVGFRYFVRDLAARAGLAGWVANRPDGSVECVAQGPRPELERLLDALREGPPWADVSTVEVDWLPPGSDLDGFGVAG